MIVALIGLFVAAGFGLEWRLARNRHRLRSSFAPADQKLLDTYPFPWRFHAARCSRDGLTTRDKIHASIHGYAAFSTITSSDGVFDSYSYTGLIPFGDLPLVVQYDKNGNLLGFDDRGAEIFLVGK